MDIARAKGRSDIVDTLQNAASSTPVSRSMNKPQQVQVFSVSFFMLFALHPLKQSTHSAALLKAAESGQRTTVESLLKKGANVNYQDEVRGNNICQITAVVHTYVLCIHFSSGLQDGLTSLFIASQEGHTEVVDTLLKNGADPNLACTVWKLMCPVCLHLGHCSTLKMHNVFVTGMYDVGCTCW